MDPLMPYPDAQRPQPGMRVLHAPCPACGRMLRTGWRDGRRVIGQHHPATEAALDICCTAQPCPGSLQPVPDGDCVPAPRSRSLAAITTGALPVVFTGAITGQMPTVPAAPPASAPTAGGAR